MAIVFCSGSGCVYCVCYVCYMLCVVSSCNTFQMWYVVEFWLV